MPRLTIDRRAVEVPPGATILDAARQLGVEIPTLCHQDGHPANTTCMICQVKVAGRWMPACATRAEEGMAVESDTDEVRRLRRTGLELILSDHPMHCRACERGDGCKLRRYSRMLGARPVRFRGEQRAAAQHEKGVRPHLPEQPGGRGRPRRESEQAQMGSDPFFAPVAFEPGKCILCGICVQIAQAAAEPLGLTFTGRGFNVRLEAPLGHSITEGLGQVAAQCIAACPVGAFTQDRLTIQLPNPSNSVH